jgi:hypothetical protein
MYVCMYVYVCTVPYNTCLCVCGHKAYMWVYEFDVWIYDICGMCIEMPLTKMGHKTDRILP